MEKNINDLQYKLRLISLFDIYGKLLTDKYQKSLTLYLLEDWSLSEIANLDSISRQAVHASITRAAKHLEDFEANLHLIDNRDLAKRSLQTLRGQIEAGELQLALAEIDRMVEKL